MRLKNRHKIFHFFDLIIDVDCTQTIVFFAVFLHILHLSVIGIKKNASTKERQRFSEQNVYNPYVWHQQRELKKFFFFQKSA